MIPVCSSAQVRALDGAVIEGVGIPGRQLMEVAAKGAFDVILRHYPRQPTLVLCGPGNNGGDGYAVARMLHLAGWPVEIWSPIEPKTSDALINQQLCLRLQIPMVKEPLVRPLMVDALLGTGQQAAPRGPIALGVAAMKGQTVVALDLPTGVNADTGQTWGDAVQAQHTVTFGRNKLGLWASPGHGLAGKVHLVDIGLDLAQLTDHQLLMPAAQCLEGQDIEGWLSKSNENNVKWEKGHVAILARGGAAVLAAHGAFAAGVGLVTVLVPKSDWGGLRGLRPEVIVAEPDILDPDRHDVLVVGPALGIQDGSVMSAWRGFPGPLVADADALTVLAGHPPHTAPGPRVVTPHSAEAARLLGISRDEVDQDRFAAVRRLKAWGTPVLKGPCTLIGAEPHPWINPTGNNQLATAGTGDVLAGFIGGFLARGLSTETAAAVATWIHGRAGETMAPRGTASDLVDQLMSWPVKPV